VYKRQQALLLVAAFVVVTATLAAGRMDRREMIVAAAEGDDVDSLVDVVVKPFLARDRANRDDMLNE
jgi:hypothetical protein